MTSSTTLQYVRTPVGRAAAFSPDTKLSSKLKAVLKAVDGKTSVSALMVQFVDHDAADLLGQLEEAGLIKLREERLGDFQAPAPVPDFVPPRQLAREAALSTFADTSSTDMATMRDDHEVGSAQPSASLMRIVDVMATFVLTHIPGQAFSVLARLEGFQTLSQLEAEMPGYSILARESGPAGVVHLAELTERLREAAAGQSQTA